MANDLGMFFYDKDLVYSLIGIVERHYFDFSLNELLELYKYMSSTFYRHESTLNLIEDCLKIRFKEPREVEKLTPDALVHMISAL